MFQNANMAIVKVTKGCNLRCSYCYIKDKDKFQGKFMSMKVFKDLVKRIIEDKSNRDHVREGEFTFVFHGGEPTTAGFDRLNKMLTYAEMMFSLNKLNVGFGIQSNLTLLTPELIKLFNKHDIGIGASFDGFGNASITRLGSKSSVLEEKLKLIKDNGGKAGVLSVVTQNNYKTIVRDSDRLLKKMRLTDSIKINGAENVLDETNNGEVLGKDLFENVHKKFIDKFMKTRNLKKFNFESNMNQILIKYFSNKVSVSDAFGVKGNCYTHFCGGGLSIVEVEPDGRVFYCGRYKEDYEEAFMSSIYDKDLFNLHSFKRWTDRMAVDYTAKKGVGCFDCRAKDICDGGCQAFYFSKFGKWGIREDLICDLFQGIHDYLEEIGDSFIIKYANWLLKNNATWNSSNCDVIALRNHYKSLLRSNKIRVSIGDKGNLVLTTAKGHPNLKKAKSDKAIDKTSNKSKNNYKDHVDHVDASGQKHT